MTSLIRIFAFIRFVLAVSIVVAVTCSGAMAQETGVTQPVKPAVTPQASISQTTKAVGPEVAKSSTVASEEQAEKPNTDPAKQGVRVHGHWIIDVRNPDGTLAEHRDFQNSLANPNDMVALLYGSEVPSDFSIYLAGTTPPCVVAAGYTCDIVRNLTVWPAAARCGNDYCVTGLTVTPNFGSNPTLVFAGNLTATQAGTVTSVGTFIGTCGSPSANLATVTSASCGAGNSIYGYGTLTATNITALSVVLGQIIQVTVTITFS